MSKKEEIRRETKLLLDEISNFSTTTGVGVGCCEECEHFHDCDENPTAEVVDCGDFNMILKLSNILRESIRMQEMYYE